MILQKYPATLTIVVICHKLKTIALAERDYPHWGIIPFPFPISDRIVFQEDAHAEAAESVYGDPKKI